jgi:hypothetical protein
MPVRATSASEFRPDPTALSGCPPSPNDGDRLVDDGWPIKLSLQPPLLSPAPDDRQVIAKPPGDTADRQRSENLRRYPERQNRDHRSGRAKDDRDHHGHYRGD